MTLSNRFGVLDDGRGPEVHVLSDEEAGSAVSDTASVVGEPIVRRRLSLVWDVDHRPQPSMDPESIDREEAGSDGAESERGMSEPDEEVVGRTIPVVQCRSVGGADQSQFHLVHHGIPITIPEEKKEPRRRPEKGRQSSEFGADGRIVVCRPSGFGRRSGGTRG